MDKGRCIIVDPGSVDLLGHHVTSLKVLDRALSPAEPVFVINEQAGDDLGLPEGRTIRRLKTSPYMLPLARSRDLRSGLPRLLYGILDAFQGGGRSNDDANVYVPELRAVIHELSISPADDIAFPTATVDLVRALTALYGPTGGKAVPGLHVRFLWDGRDDDPRYVRRVMRRFAALCSRHPGIRVYTQTSALAKRLGDAYGIACQPRSMLRHPPAHMHVAHRGGHASPFVIGCLGSAREEKGGARLEDIFARLLTLNAVRPNPHDFRFIVQSTIQSDSLRGFADRLAARLGSDACRVKFLNAALTDTQFERTIVRCDAVLLPYEPARYEVRGSGVLIDTVLRNVPVVCPPASALQEFVRQDNGLFALDDDEYARALLRIADERVRFADAAKRAGAMLRQEITTDPLVEGLRRARGMETVHSR